MTVDQVIELGKEADIAMELVKTDQGATWVWIGAGILVLVVAVILSFMMADSLSVFVGVIGVGLLMVGGISSFANKEYVVNDEVTPWIEEAVIPYLDTLPVERREVIFIKIDPELSSDTKGGLLYTHSKDVEKTPITISFKDNGKVITRTNWIETDMESSDTDKLYVEFQRLEEDLGHGVDAGYYNLKLYLPSDYTFTDIK